MVGNASLVLKVYLEKKKRTKTCPQLILCASLLKWCKLKEIPAAVSRPAWDLLAVILEAVQTSAGVNVGQPAPPQARRQCGRTQGCM